MSTREVLLTSKPVVSIRKLRRLPSRPEIALLVPPVLTCSVRVLVE